MPRCRSRTRAAHQFARPVSGAPKCQSGWGISQPTKLCQGRPTCTDRVGRHHRTGKMWSTRHRCARQCRCWKRPSSGRVHPSHLPVWSSPADRTTRSTGLGLRPARRASHQSGRTGCNRWRRRWQTLFGGPCHRRRTGGRDRSNRAPGSLCCEDTRQPNHPEWRLPRRQDRSRPTPDDSASMLRYGRGGHRWVAASKTRCEQQWPSWSAVLPAVATQSALSDYLWGIGSHVEFSGPWRYVVGRMPRGPPRTDRCLGGRLRRTGLDRVLSSPP